MADNNIKYYILQYTVTQKIPILYLYIIQSVLDDLTVIHSFTQFEYVTCSCIPKKSRDKTVHQFYQNIVLISSSTLLAYKVNIIIYYDIIQNKL